MLGEKGLRVLSALVVATAVARHLGPAQYGALAVAIAWMALPSSAAGMGTDHVNQTLLAKAGDATLLRSAYLLRVGWALVCAVTALAIVWLLQLDPLGAYVALSIGVGLVSCAIFLHALYAQGRFRLASTLGLLSLVLGVSLRLLGIHLGWGATEFAWCVMLEVALPGVLAALVAKSQRQQSRQNNQGRWCWLTARNYARLCWPTAVSAVLVALFLRLDLFIVDQQLGKQAAGAWAAAMMFVMPWGMVSAALLPVASRQLHLSAADPAQFNQGMVKLIRRMLLLALAAIAVNALALAWLVPWLLGPAYAQAVELGMVASLAILPLFLGATQELSLAYRQRTDLVLRKVLLALPLSAAMSWFGVANFGLIGAAVGMVLAQLTTTVLMNVLLDPDYFKLQLSALYPHQDNTP